MLILQTLLKEITFTDTQAIVEQDSFYSVYIAAATYPD